ncbi:MAG TPA: hypothetical protein VGA22_14595 [Gemmatimonadales bacterium]
MRRGVALRAVARRFGVALSTVQWWVRHAGLQRLDRVDWSDRSRRPHRIHRTPQAVEDAVLVLREELRAHSVLGEYGAPAIHRALQGQARETVPSLRTVSRILTRRGVLDSRRRVRRPAPPPGWYLPLVASGDAELDSVDVIEGLKIDHGPTIEVLTAISLHGGLTGAWPTRYVTAKGVVHTLERHWGDVGLPTFAQFDNDTVFQGAHQHRDCISRVMRLCLQLGVTPVFAPPREHGFQAAIESFNGRWQAKVWARYHHANLRAVQQRAARYTRAHRQRVAVRIEAAPVRRLIPAAWHLDLQRQPQGTVVFLRRTDPHGRVSLLGHRVLVDRQWTHRLVRAEVDLLAGEIRCYALRRRNPADQPLLRVTPYALPRRPFRE